MGMLFDLKQLKESGMRNGDLRLHMYDLNMLIHLFQDNAYNEDCNRGCD